jgi:hypothetical protein
MTAETPGGISGGLSVSHQKEFRNRHFFKFVEFIEFVELRVK